MAQQMEIASAGLVLEVPNTDNAELMRHMEAAESAGVKTAGGLSDLTGCMINTDKRSTVLTLCAGTGDMGIVPGLLQTPEYTLALFEGLGYDSKDPVVKWGLEARLARAELALRAGGTIINVFNARALQTNQAIGGEVLAPQLESILDITAKHPQVTARIAHADLLKPGTLGFKDMMLIYTAGESISGEEERPVHGFTDDDGSPTTRQPADSIQGLRETWDGVISLASSVEDTRRQIVQTIEGLNR
jgi:hypothetical protein